MIGIAGLGLLTVPFLKEIPMQTHTDTAYGLHDAKDMEKIELRNDTNETLAV